MSSAHPNQRSGEIQFWFNKDPELSDLCFRLRRHVQNGDSVRVTPHELLPEDPKVQKSEG